MLGAVLVTACGAGTGGQMDAALGGTQAIGAVSETEGQEDWRAVRLDDMARDRSDPEPERRNPFRFGAVTPARQPGTGRGDTAGPAVAPAPDVEPPVPAPRGSGSPDGAGGVPLIFIGFVESPGITGRVVVLADGENVFHGRVGDVLDGRYRIVGLGLESVDVERIDGRGAETLQLSSESSSRP